jgi:beta-carotene ketolase (CrtW type)
VILPGIPRARQTAIGLSLAGLIVCGWVTLHVWGIFFQPLVWPAVIAAPLLILTQSWLGAGMFIVAHDAMHGSLAPGRPRLNAIIGQVCVGAYAAFSFRRLNVCHHQHHRSPGSADDPDFHAGEPMRFGPWFYRFFTRYFGWREFGIVTAVLIAYLFAFGASPLNVALFWGLPAILSALQLFRLRHLAAASARSVRLALCRSSQCANSAHAVAGLASDLLPFRHAPRASPEPEHPLVAAARSPARSAQTRVHKAGRGGGAFPRSSTWVQIAISAPRPNSHSFMARPTDTRCFQTPGPPRATLRPISR